MESNDEWKEIDIKNRTFYYFDNIIGVYDGTAYLVLFGPKTYEAIYDGIRYLISQKSGITYSADHNFTRIRIESYNFLPIEKTLTFHNAIIFINSVFKRNQDHYCPNIFLEKGSYEDKSYTQFFKWMFVYYKCYILIELMFLKELTLIKRVRYLSLLAFFR